MPILEDLEIVRKVGCVMGDNSSTNDTLCRALAGWFEELGILPEWSAQYMRGRCLGHIINLIAKAYLVNKEILEDLEEDADLIWVVMTLASYEENQGQGATQVPKRGGKKKKVKETAIRVLETLHAIIASMANSPNRTQTMRDAADRIIPRDNATRWNS
jgi:hypothetical protein